MNKVIMIGRLTRDPEVRYTQGPNSIAVARITVAVDRRFKREGEPEADFFNWTGFGRQAEFLEKYFAKGMKIVLTGRAQNDVYTDRNGSKVYATVYIIEEAEFGEPKSAGTGKAGADMPGEAPDGFMSIPTGVEEELPFM